MAEKLFPGIKLGACILFPRQFAAVSKSFYQERNRHCTKILRSQGTGQGDFRARQNTDCNRRRALPRDECIIKSRLVHKIRIKIIQGLQFVFQGAALGTETTL